jgi:hypothetical protein
MVPVIPQRLSQADNRFGLPLPHSGTHRLRAWAATRHGLSRRYDAWDSKALSIVPPQRPSSTDPITLSQTLMVREESTPQTRNENRSVSGMATEGLEISAAGLREAISLGNAAPSLLLWDYMTSTVLRALIGLGFPTSVHHCRLEPGTPATSSITHGRRGMAKQIASYKSLGRHFVLHLWLPECCTPLKHARYELQA